MTEVSPLQADDRLGQVAVPQVAHIGYHRTGTNLLQKEIFPKLGDTLFQPSASGWRFFDDEAGFDEATARAFYEGEQRRNPDGKLFLISAERMTGTELGDDLSVPDKLYRLNAHMKIILVLRSQYSIFPSLYHLHVKRNGTLSYPAFLERSIEGGRCNYRAMVERLFGLFGRDAVLVLLYEELKRAPDDFIDQLCDFLGVAEDVRPRPCTQVNARHSDAVLKFRRFANATLALDRRPAPWKHHMKDLGSRAVAKADSLARRLDDRPLAPLDVDSHAPLIDAAYAEDNRRLAELIGKPLARYGYPF